MLWLQFLTLSWLCAAVLGLVGAFALTWRAYPLTPGEWVRYSPRFLRTQRRRALGRACVEVIAICSACYLLTVALSVPFLLRA